MKVSAQYALSHFDDISAAVERGEEVAILRTGKSALHLVQAPAEASQSEWRLPERPRAELLGSLKDKLVLSADWDSPETNKEIEDLFEDSRLFPDTLHG